MSEARAPSRIRMTEGLGAIPPAAWDACAAPGGVRANPFLTHAFLSSLEEAGCVGPGTGWTPAHLLLETGAGDLLAAAPAYFKSHSQGEYVFDHGWAEALERAGGRYYPKLQLAVPFTPVTGHRFLVRPDTDRPQAERALLSGAVELAARAGASSVHVTFLTRDEYTRLGTDEMLRREDQQFHWTNEGYESFEAFLASLASRKRKDLRKERAPFAEAGISFRWLRGREITEGHWDAVFAFYMDTASRKWGRPYLNRQVFSLIGERLGEAVVLILAERAGRPIAGALNLLGTDTLFGRYWGCIEDHPFLHFETCYYQAIDYAIAHGLARVEAGAQGAHKVARGYRPVTTYSLHWIAHAGLRAAVARYLEAERSAVAEDRAFLEDHTPFRKG
ncbi:MAG: N-acetyltransferase [Alphaproteobacteria bacterium]|nr:N-acetyltransferase [Alphaproteobacteria bacterium]